MKKWTVMLVPQGQGVTRTLHLYSFQLWLFIVTIVGLAFTSAFLFQWYKAAEQQARILEKSNHNLARAKSEVAPPAASGISDEERTEIERRVRSEYEEQNAVVAKELGELRDLEDSIRRVQKLPPKIKRPYGIMMNVAPNKADDGKGGPADRFEEPVKISTNDIMSPPQLIYGMSRPPADLIVQEINLRTESLRELMTAMDEKRDRIERTPLGWPILSRQRQISSGFGPRFDPFTHRLARHDGLDIRAPYGTKIYATARGVVVESGYDGDYGNKVVVRHGDGFETVYGHMSERLVQVGQEVGRGDVLGLVGSTGRSTGNHCHYEVHIGGSLVDPENYLGN